MKYKRIIIKGIVQGVGFRAFIYKKALSLPSVKGYVRNLNDGSVEIVCSGNEDEINALIKAGKKGPFGSRVDLVEISEIDLDDRFMDFTIKY